MTACPITADHQTAVPEQQLRAALIICELRRQVKIDRSYWLNLCNSPIDLMRLADTDGKSLLERANGALNEPAIRSVLNHSGFHRRVREQFRQAGRLGIRALSWVDPDYPPRLRQISGFPLILFVRGHLPLSVLASGPAVTIVGTRQPTAYGRSAVRRLVADLSAAGLLVISGLARGIDGLAHAECLRSGGRTLAVLASGLDRVYPDCHRELLSSLLQGGLAISEHPPGTPPISRHFPARNRILSGLSDATCVIEAARSSGSLITASFAADQGRDVFAVPGSIFSAASQGCNQLIRDGAAVLLSAADVLSALPQTALEIAARLSVASMSSGRIDPSGQSPSAKHELSEFSTDERNILQTLAARSLTFSELCEHGAMSASQLSVLLTRLEIASLICHERGRYTLTDPASFCI